jgi:nicotinamidase-related amidase
MVMVDNDLNGEESMMGGSWRGAGVAVALLGSLIACATMASAQSIVDEWSSVAVPPPPALKPASLDPKTTALIVMDFVKQSCNSEARPRCVASIPKVKAMIAAAKAKGVTVMWTLPPGPKPEDFLSDVAPPAGTGFAAIAPVDKFYGTDLEKQLKDKGLTTVVLVGTTAQGAVLYTASEAALRGFNVVVPVDGSTAASTYAEQATTWVLANAPTVSQKVTLTRSDMLSYQ